MEDYTVINGKKFRKGYTTGSCAAAAAKAAVVMLISGKVLSQVDIDTPAGIRLTLPVTDVEFPANGVRCSVVKDGGDDPDMTTGLKVLAGAGFMNTEGIAVKAGEGIGTVLLPGLKVPVGQPAINPVPMRMILKEVGEVLPQGKGVEITLSVPGGDVVAKSTYNPRLGIEGGISILGTTGIVNPMSEEAWKDSLALELNVMAARGLKQIAYAFGNYGEDFAVRELGIDSDSIIKVSNFIGFMLDKAVECGLEKILLVGHLGKLVKVAAGIFQTHSRIADARMEILSSYAALAGAPKEITGKIYDCRTTEAAAEVINANGLRSVYDRIVSNASRRCEQYTFNKISFGTVLFHSDNTLLAMDETGKEIIKELRKRDG